MITVECEHNRGEHCFKVSLEGAVDSNHSKDLKLITEPPEYAKKEFAIKGSVSLLLES